MSQKQAANDSSPRAKWSQILDLGEQLSCLGRDSLSNASSIQTTIKIQNDLIIEATDRLLEGRSQLWLAEAPILGQINRLSRRAGDRISPVSHPTSPLMKQVLETRKGWGRSEGAATQFWPFEKGITAQKFSALALPLLSHETEQQKSMVLGVLQIERPAGNAFTQEDIELFGGLGNQVSVSLHAIQQMIRERWRVQQLALVHEVSAQITNVRELDELAGHVTNLILETFDYYYVAIFTLESGSDVLCFRASAGPQLLKHDPKTTKSEAEAQTGPVVHIGEGIVGYVAQSGQELLANNVQSEAHYRFLDTLPETGSEVALPLKIEDQLLGVLDVQSDQRDDFDETDLLVLRAMASNIAFAVHGTRLYNTLHQRADQLATIYEVSGAITSILEQENLLEEVANLIQKRFGYPFVHLFTVHPGRRKVFFEAGSSPYSQALREQRYACDLDATIGLIPWVARQGETALVNEVHSDPRYSPSAPYPEETLSELTIPLIFGGEVLGILDIQSDHLNAFSEEDRFLFEALAGNIAIALRNATLYRSEVWRRQAADGLHEVAGLLSADVGLDQVLQAILTELERSLPLDLAAIWLVDEGSTDEDETPCLYLAAIHGASTTELDLEPGLSPDDVLEFSEPLKLVPQIELASTWLNEALAAAHPIVRTSQSPFDPLGAALSFPADYSAIAAPLRAGEQRLGVLTLAHRTSGRYGSEARAMTAAFASYAAVAIENLRLYESAHDQAWVSTVLLQVTEATQSQTNLNELLTTVINMAPMLAGIKACLLYMLDEDGAFVPAVASGLSTEQQIEFERWRFEAGDVAALDQLLIEKTPVILSEKSADLRLASIMFANPIDAPVPTAELLVLVPLLARREVLGAFLVDYSYDHQPSPHDGKALNELFDERLAIIQGIAHQTAIAVENIRLIKSQKEEAYISVALLQVAQAVVSSNELDEILGSIVRITPILVGVNRAVIYLWDSGRECFILSQVYGVPRHAQVPTYSPGEFPLLDLVRLEDHPAAYPLESSATTSEDIIDDWSYLPAPDSEEIEIYVQNAGRLLLAFPLSVSGNVLGVLLVEEPDPTPTLSFGVSGANYRLRERRMEIITGISQQAALAIQNDHLQSEMVTRERLEREMQLAREIQRTFLPQHLPDLPFWDIKVRWRPAREVGGDFYDFFNLPDGRLGMVIADVADKGMPAALFMTLVRTLVRATVQETASPTEVLARVNDVLVPDAPQGMFVTLVYAILSPETGELEYANAGHNLPLILRESTCTLEHLKPGGMALGVMEGNQLKGFQVSLEPGDFLILYTDGITEAFSPQGELYDEDRLCHTIREAAVSFAAENSLTSNTALDMLNAIDESVTDFIGDSPPSDDLTLVVLKRTAE